MTVTMSIVPAPQRNYVSNSDDLARNSIILIVYHFVPRGSYENI